VSIWRVIHWFTNARFAAQNWPNPKTGLTFLEYDKMTADMFTFFVCARVTVSERFYSLFNGFVPTTSEPPTFDVSFNLGFVGMSSLSTVGTMLDRNTGEEVARNINQVLVESSHLQLLSFLF
jgi:hypothetical protein